MKPMTIIQGMADNAMRKRVLEVFNFSDELQAELVGNVEDIAIIKSRRQYFTHLTKGTNAVSYEVTCEGIHGGRKKVATVYAYALIPESGEVSANIIAIEAEGARWEWKNQWNRYLIPLTFQE